MFIVTATYSIGSVTSTDGTRVGYRRVGLGPGLVLVHGGGQCAQNLMQLALVLSGEFTVHVPDRRGRGSSGPPGDHYGLAVECQDLDALLRHTGSEFVFGLSSGALVCLDAALSLRQIRKLALYEPPLSIDHSTPVDWLGRFDREIAEGKIGSAMITATRGTRTAPALIRWTPRFLLAPVLDMVARRSAVHSDDDGTSAHQPMSPRRRAMLRVTLWPVRRFAASRTAQGPGDDEVTVPLSALVPTMHYDAQLVLESEGRLPDYHAVAVPVLLLGGSDSPTYLRRTLTALEATLPRVQRVELLGAGHIAPDNTGEPERVAAELSQFFGPDVRSSREE
jgi:pimeloyl-ACP methyl ester carboxylesterase